MDIEPERGNREVDQTDMDIAGLVVAVFLVPILLVYFAPENRWVDLFLGDGRILLTWVVLFFFVHKAERYLRRIRGQDNRR